MINYHGIMATLRTFSGLLFSFMALQKFLGVIFNFGLHTLLQFLFQVLHQFFRVKTELDAHLIPPLFTRQCQQIVMAIGVR